MFLPQVLKMFGLIWLITKRMLALLLYLFVFECQVITSRGGRFLEAPVAGSQQLSNDGMLVILAAGDRTVYEDCSSCFQAMGKTSFFLGMYLPTVGKKKKEGDLTINLQMVYLTVCSFPCHWIMLEI